MRNCAGSIVERREEELKGVREARGWEGQRANKKTKIEHFSLFLFHKLYKAKERESE